MIKAVLSNSNAWAVLEGGPDLKPHNLMLALTSSGIANRCSDLAWLSRCLAALLHPGYRGNTKGEIFEMLQSAAAKGLGGYYRSYEPGEEGPVPLGYTKDGSYALLDRLRQIILLCFAHQLLSAQYLVGLAPSRFWLEHFPGRKGINSQAAGEALIAACKHKGAFIPTKVRGRGIWREGERVVINLGQRVDSSKYLYLCFEPIALEAEAEFDAARLLALLKLFNWRSRDDAMLLFGWLALAPICGVVSWRPHCFVYGPARSGKTTSTPSQRPF